MDGNSCQGVAKVADLRAMDFVGAQIWRASTTFNAGLFAELGAGRPEPSEKGRQVSFVISPIGHHNVGLTCLQWSKRIEIVSITGDKALPDEPSDWPSDLIRSTS